MFTTLILLTLSTPSIPAPLLTPAVPVVRVQDDEEVPDKRPEIKELLETFKEHTTKRGREDTDAVAIIDRLLQEFPQSGPKDKKAMVTALGKCFDQTRKELEGGVKDNKLFIAAAVAFGRWVRTRRRRSRSGSGTRSTARTSLCSDG